MADPHYLSRRWWRVWLKRSGLWRSPVGSQWWSHPAPPSRRQAARVVSYVTHVSSAVSPRHMFAGKRWQNRCWMFERIVLCRAESITFTLWVSIFEGREHRHSLFRLLSEKKRREFEFLTTDDIPVFLQTQLCFHSLSCRSICVWNENTTGMYWYQIFTASAWVSRSLFASLRNNFSDVKRPFWH